MASLQTELYDATVRHSIDLVRYSNGVVRRIIALLNRVDIDLAEQVARAMERLPASAFTVARLDAVLKDVRNPERRGVPAGARRVGEGSA